MTGIPGKTGVVYTLDLGMRNELAPGTDQLGAVWGISAETGATTWIYEQRAATMSPELRPSSGNNLFVFALPDR